MSNAATDPYAVLGVAPDVSDGELRRAYRDLVKRHHPDHNGGSPESTVRFAQIQSAYALIAERRRAPAGEMDDRIAAIEAELRRQTAAREAAARAEAVAARAAAAARAEAAARAAAAPQATAGGARPQPRRPTQEELGYYTTDDSFTKIIDDATDQFAERLRGGDAKRQFTQRLADLFGRGSR
ncbi:MAG TPA: J domain-containing protein [Solirubrobacteraceae bacterium]|jgi:curved DNA-binding protein CbpA|nr:J domain-containing protein [Solirubrobacteraceae bacterium]